jgi:hypothetical protein
MIRSHTVATVAAAGLLACGATVAVAAPTSSPAPTSVPGPKQPIEHLGLSGGLFQALVGEPDCYASGGIAMASFPVPRGGLVTGVTAYVTDGSSTARINVALNRHSLVSGGTYRLGAVYTTGAPGSTELSVDLDPGVLISEASSVNVEVTVGKGTCFRGAEVHFIRNGAAVAQPIGAARAPEPTVTAAGPDGALR